MFPERGLRRRPGDLSKGERGAGTGDRGSGSGPAASWKTKCVREMASDQGVPRSGADVQV